MKIKCYGGPLDGEERTVSDGIHTIAFPTIISKPSLLMSKYVPDKFGNVPDQPPWKFGREEYWVDYKHGRAIQNAYYIEKDNA